MFHLRFVFPYWFSVLMICPLVKVGSWSPLLLLCCCLFLLLCLLVFALCIKVLLCWVHRRLQLLCLLLGLIPWSLCSVLPYLLWLQEIFYFILRSILSDMRTATPAFFCFSFVWNKIFHPLTFDLYVCLGMGWLYCRQHIYVSCFCIHSASLCLLVGAFSPFTFKATLIYIFFPIVIFLIVGGLFL